MATSIMALNTGMLTQQAQVLPISVVQRRRNAMANTIHRGLILLTSLTSVIPLFWERCVLEAFIEQGGLASEIGYLIRDHVLPCLTPSLCYIDSLACLKSLYLNNPL